MNVKFCEVCGNKFDLEEVKKCPSCAKGEKKAPEEKEKEASQENVKEKLDLLKRKLN